MASDTPDSNDLVIRKSALSMDHASSRLLRRGLAALNEVRTVCLEVGKLNAFESAVFVFAEGWDSFRTDVMNKTETWKAKRSVVCFEFDRTGAYVRKIAMPLINLTGEGYARIRSRHIREITIRTGFIHLYEDLYTEAEERPLRVDYLFSRTGERQAIWSDSDFVDQHRRSDEPVVPMAPWLKPEWADSTRLIALYEHHDSLGDPPPLTNSDEDLYSYGKTFEYLVVSQDTEQFVAQITGLQGISEPEKRTPVFDLNHHHHDVVHVPVGTQLYVGNRTNRLWGRNTTSDSWAACFLAGPGSGADVFWLLKLSNSGASVTTYSLPHSDDLIRHGFITIDDDNGDPWVPPISSQDPEYEI